MEFIEKKIKRRTPVKIKTVNYKDFEINYVERKASSDCFLEDYLINLKSHIIRM